MINQPTLEQIKNDPRPKNMLDINQVSEKTGLGVSTIKKKKAEGTFPQPVQYEDMPYKNLWPDFVIDDWINQSIVIG